MRVASFAFIFSTILLSSGWADFDFNRDIKPILSENCYFCHGPDGADRKADLRLDTYDGAVDSAVVPGKPEESELIARVFSIDADEQMPPPEAKISLTARERELLKEWVAAGAEYDPHWSFAPPTKVEVPVEGNPIDHLVAEELGKRGMTLAEEADRHVLLRRVYLDLTGLPPTPEQVAQFVADREVGAFDRLVDRLLRSPAYGERMAWDWLDAARYADSNGYQGDNERTMWPWRDWVVKAFNENMPYDQFTVWQLAGDLLPDASDESRLATGFCRNHPINGEGGRIAEENRVDYVMDMAETAGTVWLGLTMNCCRCHDHKFDPLSQKDYYAFSGFFNQTPVNGGGGNAQTPPVLRVPSDKESEEIKMLSGRIQDAGRRLLGLENSDRWWRGLGSAKVVGLRATREKLTKNRDALEKRVPKVMVMADMETPRKTFVLASGLYSERGVEVIAEVPEALPPMPDSFPKNRLGLAKWLVAVENPLTARVTVNRLWQQLFGIGLVKTTEDFGVQGELPPQQALLDWLAVDFVENGWDVKRLMKQIVTSKAYRQTSKSDDGYVEDPQNRWLARGPRFRMPSWMLRDQALSVSGLLIARQGGVPLNPYQPSGVWEEPSFGKKKYKQDTGEDLYRRSLYTFWRRIAPPTAFFDNSGRQICEVRPMRTNTPLQALYTLNGVTFVEAARVLAERAMVVHPDDVEARFNFIFFRVLSRTPVGEERDILSAAMVQNMDKFLQAPNEAKAFLAVGDSARDESLDVIEHASWTALSLAILNLDEAVTKP